MGYLMETKISQESIINRFIPHNYILLRKLTLHHSKIDYLHFRGVSFTEAHNVIQFQVTVYKSPIMNTLKCLHCTHETDRQVLLGNSGPFRYSIEQVAAIQHLQHKDGIRLEIHRVLVFHWTLRMRENE
jgi:hypothetical protein